MSEAEALAILNVTERRPKWLIISQVHPDKAQTPWVPGGGHSGRRTREPSHGCVQQACE